MVAKYDVGRLDSSGSTQPNGSNVSINTQEDTLNDGSVPFEIQGHTVRRSKRGHIPKRHFEVDWEAYICIPSEEGHLPLTKKRCLQQPMKSGYLQWGKR
ncbi:hypothetical protein ACFX14_009299 [Malus domestica]